MMAVALGRSRERKALEQLDPSARAGQIGATFGLLAALPIVLILPFVTDAYGWSSDWMYLPMAAAALTGIIGGAAWRKRRLRHHPAAATIGRGEDIGLRIYFFALVFSLQALSLFWSFRSSTTLSAVGALAIFLASAACIPAYVAQLRGPVRLAAAIPLGVASSIAASLLGVALATQFTGS